jgi:hypothetical protein
MELRGIALGDKEALDSQAIRPLDQGRHAFFGSIAGNGTEMAVVIPNAKRPAGFRSSIL